MLNELVILLFSFGIGIGGLIHLLLILIHVLVLKIYKVNKLHYLY